MKKLLTALFAVLIMGCLGCSGAQKPGVMVFDPDMPAERPTFAPAPADAHERAEDPGEGTASSEDPTAESPAPELTADPSEAAAGSSAAPRLEPTPTPEPTPAPAPATLADRIAAAMEASGLMNTMAPLTAEEIPQYYSVDASLLASAAALVDTEGYTCEILILEGKDGSAGDALLKAVKAYKSSRQKTFASYDPAAEALVKKAPVIREGNTVIFIVSEAAEELADAARTAF